MNETTMPNKLNETPLRRRALLPLWIKIFLWIFMVLGFIAPLGLLFGLLGMGFNLSLYGLETTNALSVIGLLILLLFAIKSAVSFGLWLEKEWAVNLAIIDASFGIIVCLFVLIFPLLVENSDIGFSIRLELVALVPYLQKMMNIKQDWLDRVAKN